MRTRTMRKKLEERSAPAAAPAAAASAGGRSAPPPAASQAFRLHIPGRRHSPHGAGALQLPPLSLRSKKAKATPRENQPGAHLKTPRVRVPTCCARKCPGLPGKLGSGGGKYPLVTELA